MLRSKVRTILTITAIFIGALTITLTVGISSGVSSYMDKQVNSIGAKDVLIVQRNVEVSTESGPQKYDPDKQSTSAQAAMLNSILNDDDIASMKEQDGLISVKPMLLVAPDYITGKNDEKYQIAIHPVVESANFEYVAGRMPDNKSATPEILLPVNFVEALGYNSSEAAVGQQVELTLKNPAGQQSTVAATVSGVQQESLISQGGAGANDALTGALYAVHTEGMPAGSGARYVGAIAMFDKNSTPDQLQKIKDGLKEKGYMGSTVEDKIGIIKQVIDAITYVLIFFGAIALLAASFGIINTLYMSVQERTKEIGLMKAMGMSRFKVFLLFSVEAVLLGFWGSFIGVVTAIAIGQTANGIASNSFLKDLPGFDLMTFPPLSVATIILIVMLIAFLAGTLPARRAAKQDPIEALRYE